MRSRESMRQLCRLGAAGNQGCQSAFGDSLMGPESTVAIGAFLLESGLQVRYLIE